MGNGMDEIKRKMTLNCEKQHQKEHLFYRNGHRKYKY